MNIFRKFCALLLVLVLLLPLTSGISAAETSADDLIRQMINYYHHYQADAQTDIDLLLEELEKQSPALAKCWDGILDFWIHLNKDMAVHDPVLPDGLPNDNSLCIVIMGFYLEANGEIRQELADRLNVALASAEKYPNAYILCTGGGTASKNAKVTEAGQMAQWLTDRGISHERIITETKASSTIENAKFGCDLLYRDYPQIQSLALITSDYHIRRSCLYFNTQAALTVPANGEPLKVVAGASCPIKGESPTDIDTQTEGMAILTDLKVLNMSKPPLSVLEDISVNSSGAQAVYSTGLTRDISADVTYEALETDDSGIKTVTATYAENGITKTAVIKLEDLPSDAKVRLSSAQISMNAPSIAATEAAQSMPLPPAGEITSDVTPGLPETTEATQAAPLEGGNFSDAAPTLREPAEPPLPLNTAVWIAGGCVLILIILLALKSRSSKKQSQK